MEKGKSLAPLEIMEIMKVLPHRYPFLLVDRVLEIIPGERLTALKNVTANEPFFTGHFPGRPVMPGVLILEALAQAAAVLLFKSRDDAQAGEIIFLGGIDGVRFRRPVVPGDQLILEISGVKRRGPVFRVEARARVGEETAAEAQITASTGRVANKEETL